MDLTQLANLGEFIGGVAVLVTLIYLAVQVRHARGQLAEQAVATAVQSTFSAVQTANNKENASVLRRGLDRPDELDEDERFLFERLMIQQAGALIAAGRSNDEISRLYVAGWRDVLFDDPGARRWLEGYPDGPIREAVREVLNRATT